MNAPVATERKSFLPLRLPSKTIIESGSVPITHRQTTAVATPMTLTVENDTKSLFAVGDRVLINGLKSGTLRYVGVVKFAQGLFCGIELDEPDGKHDGLVNNIRYFQCKTNHGIFVPQDKVILISQGRTTSTSRIISRLQPPKMTRSLTLPSSMNRKLQPIQIKSSPTSNHLPDIIPNTSNSIQSMTTNEQPIVSDNHETVQLTIETNTMMEPLSVTNDESLETDFTDSVSLILHQLQQEQKAFFSQPSTSTIASEEGTIDDESDDDEDDDDTDGLDSESIADSAMSEQVQSIPSLPSTKSIQTDLSFDIKDNITFVKNNLLKSKSMSISNKSLVGSIKSVTKPKINTQENNVMNGNVKRESLPAHVAVVKKGFERKSSIPLTNNSSTTRKSLLIPPKKTPTSISRLSSLNWEGSQSKLNQPLSPSNSLNSSHSDLSSNQQRTSNIATKSTLRTFRPASHSIDLNLDKKPKQARNSLDTTDNQLIIQKVLCQSLEVTNERLKKRYQTLLNRFDPMLILSQYYIAENEQIKQQHELKLSKIRTEHSQLKNFIEQLQLSHKNEIVTLNEKCKNQINAMKETYNEKCLEYQRQIDKLCNEKIQLETRSKSLQEQVDRFMEEMENSEHADPLLRRVETLEKDKASLQTVVEMRNQELTQLRTRINEQVFQREDQLALQRRIDMAENRNQDLVCLLRNWQLNEKAAMVERDQLKEQVALLERDNQQLTFEKETLLYRLRQRSLSASITSPPKSNVNSRSTQKVRNRARSFSSIIATNNTHANGHLTRSSSLNCILNR
ncbi:unnamed protein product [Rotaria socialis]|uniref:CAP-Gly domain-containing protein n=1 Tax=Rotaria socialis TaxID=392032 RepID=A0A818BM18_9BILA|nr:unnamed protein product [Rotaria socialis]CAF3420888.1 unnamed protein product [Rotaria socialis]CAF4419065.1 unnamed protein product [Rotaria socialis]